jgi:hypothetical protein
VLDVASSAATCRPRAELALDVLAGPLFYRLPITGGPIDGQLPDGVVELILRSFAPPKPSGRRSLSGQTHLVRRDPRSLDLRNFRTPLLVSTGRG